MSGNDFWESINLSPEVSSVETYLGGNDLVNEKFAALQALTDRGREENGLPLPVFSGQRVSFVINIGSVLSMDTFPGEGVEGTVVMVRTAEGNTTYIDQDVFIKWDDGTFNRVHRHFLRPASTSRRTASSFRRMALSMGDLSDFMRAGTKSELVHKSTQDLWSFEQGDEGFVINRLFDDTGEPLKG